MAKDDFQTPEMKEYYDIPKITPDIMKNSRPFVAKPEHQKALGFPGELIDNWEA